MLSYDTAMVALLGSTTGLSRKSHPWDDPIGCVSTGLARSVCKGRVAEQHGSGTGHLSFGIGEVI